MFIFNSTIVYILGLQRISLHYKLSNLQLIQQETCRHPQVFMSLLPSVEKEPVPNTCVARDSRAMSGSVGGYSQTLPELPADAPHCAAGWDKVLPGVSSPAMGLVCASSWLLGLFCFSARALFYVFPPHLFLQPFWQHLFIC